MFKNMRKSSVDQADEAPGRVSTGVVDLVNKFQAVIAFEPNGTILEANDNFLNAMAYSRDEVVGKHHRIFVEPEYAVSAEYTEFWDRLGAGQAFSDVFMRIRKDGEKIWIQATYFPVLGPDGKVVRVVKAAVDVTERELASRMVTKLEGGLENIANGDLATRIPEVGSHTSLAKLFNTAVKQLSTMLIRSQSVGASVAEAATSLEGASLELTRKSETTAAAVEETSAAVRGLTDVARERADQVASMEVDARRTLETAHSSREVVSKAIEAMDQLESNSSEIANIVSVIDDISFQTSLLALNAGVEAARAGDAGRGFAVVAQEVRALAQRAADSAREIKALINGSSEQVGEGVALVRQTGDELKLILENVSKISEGIVDIANGVTEQAGQLREIDVALADIDGVTQSNAAMVNNNIDTCQRLTREATELHGELSNFSVDRNLAA